MINEVDPAANRSTANGATTVFPYTFEISSNTDIEVLVDNSTKAVGTDYTVDGIGNSGGGNVTFLSAPANGTIVTRIRKQPASQLSDYAPNEPVPAERIEADLDKLVMQIQQVREQLKRGLFLAKSSSIVDQVVGAPVEGSFLRYNAGTGYTHATPTNASPASLPISIANGGTGQVTALTARQALVDVAITAKGQSFWGDATASLSVVNGGADGDVLVYRSDAGAGVQGIQLYPENYAPNPFFEVDQIPNLSAQADDTYGHDHWYRLSQSNPIGVQSNAGLLPTSPTAATLTQSNAVAQHMGYACIIESSLATKLRSTDVTLSMDVLTSSGTVNIRQAIVEWTGSLDVATSDIVNLWTSTDYTDGANKFFVDANLAPIASNATSVVAGITTKLTPLVGTAGSSLSNLILFVWTESAVAQNFQITIGNVRLANGIYYGECRKPSFLETLRYAQRWVQKSFLYGTTPAQNVGAATGESFGIAGKAGATANQILWVRFDAPMFGTPAITLYNPLAANAQIRDYLASADFSASSAGRIAPNGFNVTGTGNAGTVVGNEIAIHWTAINRL